MNTFWDNVLRVVAVIGLLAVLLLGAWGIIQLAFVLPSFFGDLGGNISSLFNRTPAAETLTVSLPMSVNAEQPFGINWKHSNKNGEYSYALSYACATGLSIAASTPVGTYAKVPCNTAFNYVNASTSMPLVAILDKGTKATATTITVSATKLSSGTVTISGHGTTTVNRAVATSSKPTTQKTTPPSKPATKYVPSGRTTNLYGAPDLAVTVSSAYTSSAGRVTIQFVVSNIGTNVTPLNWSLLTVLPIAGGNYQYPSGPQQALYPGDKIFYTLVFDLDSPTGNSVTIQVDPYNQIYETSKANNFATATFTSSINPYNQIY